MPDSNRPVAVVTGANSGIGLETARGLGRFGYDVVLLCRNEQRADAAREALAESVPEAFYSTVIADLGVMADVREAAETITAGVPHLDLLVNNAAITIRKPETTSEGNDMMLAVNHLGPFLLTNLLLPMLTKSAPSRVVNVASEAHKFGRGLDLDDIQATRGYGFMGFPRYGETKLMNILFTSELARRTEGSLVRVNSVHPGAVGTNLGSPPAPVRWLLGKVFLSPEQGAMTSLAAATSAEFSTASGHYFVKSKIADGKLHERARDDDAAARLWEMSADLVGL